MRALAVSLLSVFPLFSFISSFSALAQQPSLGEIVIEQETPLVINGTWTLLRPGEQETKGRNAAETLADILPGRHTLFITAPEGTATTVDVLDGATVLQSADSPQITFDVAEGARLRIRIAYTLVYAGKVGVSSTPPGIPFELIGPNSAIYSGTTPHSYNPMPIGLYTVKYHPPGCPTPPQKSNSLNKDKSLYFSVDIHCEALKEDAETEADRARFVSIDVNGKTVVFRDVPQGEWFAPHVAAIAKLGIMSGYRDASGEPTGEFGPGNPVTLGELAKLAHEVAGIDESAVYWTVRNESARGAWFETYVGSAEQRDWQVFTQSGVTMTRPATRGEMIVTMLQALDVPVQWPKGLSFRDVTRRTPYAGAIETAAKLGIVTGEADPEGKPTGKFNPQKPVNRAEMSKLLVRFIEKFRHEQAPR